MEAVVIAHEMVVVVVLDWHLMVEEGVVLTLMVVEVELHFPLLLEEVVVADPWTSVVVGVMPHLTYCLHSATVVKRMVLVIHQEVVANSLFAVVLYFLLAVAALSR